MSGLGCVYRDTNTTFGTASIVAVAKGVEAIRVNRGISKSQVMREMGITSREMFYQILSGKALSPANARLVKIWLQKWSTPCQTVSKP